MANIDEEKLIRLAREGYSRAIEELTKRYYSYVFGIVLNIVKNNADAADITQNVFIAVIMSIKYFKLKAGFSTWLYRIAFNAANGFIRLQKAKKRYGKLAPLHENIKNGKALQPIDKIVLSENHGTGKYSQRQQELIRIEKKHPEKTQEEKAKELGVSLATYKNELKSIRKSGVKYYEE